MNLLSITLSTFCFISHFFTDEIDFTAYLSIASIATEIESNDLFSSNDNLTAIWGIESGDFNPFAFESISSSKSKSRLLSTYMRVGKVYVMEELSTNNNSHQFHSFDTMIDPTDTTDMHRSAIWHTESFNYDTPFPYGRFLNTIEVVEDTLIDDRYCYVLGVTSNNVYYPESEMIVFVKEGKFLFYEDDEWRLLYDFKAQEGDTVSYYIPKTYRYYSEGEIPMTEENNALLELNPHQIIVMNVDSISDVNGLKMRRYQAFWDFNEASHDFGYIVDRVGSLNHLTGSYLLYSGDLLPPRVRCYSDDEVSFNFVGEPCDQLSSVSDIADLHISIYPNPFQDVINVTKAVAEEYHYEILNIKGNSVQHGRFTDEETTISTAGLVNGLYIIRITNPQGVSRSIQMVKIQ
jgi:hypothetical protein